jgi:GNAT superfamily N-acetyltransferase
VRAAAGDSPPNRSPPIVFGALFAVRPLEQATWPDFARLVERNNGVWGGCWCMGFHAEGVGRGKTVAQNRSEKEARVREGRAHAALVFDGPECVGWCQFGSPDELPRIKRRREYLKGLGELPDWRITCFFVDKAHRRSGVAAAALDGALREIARLGGGTVESYPEDSAGRSVSSSFLHNGTVSLFEQYGFARTRPLGKHHWVVSKVVV